MLISVVDNSYQETDELITDCMELAAKLDNGVSCWDESKNQFIEVHPESTITSVYKYHGWSE